ncbi:NAD(P)-dependent oxidoreductase [Pseudorhodoplanes sinuspersici]|uniref:NAD(P)-dependent oxidoreductase n=1 Tax=Pseudorhodoplanes sinuspersici TaxID=1235591 RepID=UPI000FF5B3FF|nr:NAD(P)-dependent oxidoreductase [Pseudorhodoplanes sinuspersici]RKE73593.1 3-hydroxyisobutyrate dehydrogenase [Pseudorhodoplanes sinuspersici]
MTDIKTVGFIGLGNMGVPMAANIRRGGYEVVGFDLDPARAKAFAQEHNARATDQLAELGRACDAIVTMLPTGREVRDALFNMQGGALAANLRPGAFIIDMSSADPVGTRELGKDVAARKLVLVDAPVSGGVPRAKDGSLAIMIGGDADAVAAVKPVLACMGNKLFEVGSLGCGHAMKCLNNFLAAASFAAASEAMTVGRKFGLDPAVLADVVNVSTGRSFVSENLLKQHVLSGVFGTGFALGLLAKDVRIAADLADQIGVDAPVGRLISGMWADARDALGGEQDHTRAVIHWEKRALPSAAE